MSDLLGLSNRLFAKRAAGIAQKAAKWAGEALADDPNAAFSPEAAAAFAAEITHVLNIIVRDAN